MPASTQTDHRRLDEIVSANQLEKIHQRLTEAGSLTKETTRRIWDDLALSHYGVDHSKLYNYAQRFYAARRKPRPQSRTSRQLLASVIKAHEDASQALGKLDSESIARIACLQLLLRISRILWEDDDSLTLNNLYTISRIIAERRRTDTAGGSTTPPSNSKKSEPSNKTDAAAALRKTIAEIYGIPCEDLPTPDDENPQRVTSETANLLRYAAA